MSSSTSSPSAPDGLDALWAPVREAPDDEARHRSFVTYAVESGRYLEAIERYKALEKEPGLESLARGWQERIAAQVALKLLVKGPDAEAQLGELTRRRSKWMVGAGLVLCALAGVTWGRPFAAMGLVLGLPLVATGLVVYSRAKSK